MVSTGPFFKEFVVRCPAPVAEVNRKLLEEYGILGGYDLGQDYPALQDHMLLCVTEMNSRAEIEELADALVEIGRGEAFLPEDSAEDDLASDEKQPTGQAPGNASPLREAANV